MSDALALHLPAPPTADDRPTPAQAVEPLLLSARDLAALLRLGLRTVRTMDAAGKLPAPVRVGGSVRWRVSEIHAWLDAGCPDRQTWGRIYRPTPK
jgi:excisionase family DNA binding protein